jgi:hypothetical protein
MACAICVPGGLHCYRGRRLRTNQGLEFLSTGFERGARPSSQRRIPIPQGTGDQFDGVYVDDVVSTMDPEAFDIRIVMCLIVPINIGAIGKLGKLYIVCWAIPIFEDGGTRAGEVHSDNRAVDTVHGEFIEPACCL